MTELSEDTKFAACYPSVTQYELWEDQSEQMGYNSVSQFMIEMIEAGHKQLTSSITYDEETSELRAQRNELKRELDASRERIDQLEERLYRGERRAILRFLSEQEDGVPFAEIVQHVIDDTPARVAEILEEMESEQIESSDGNYHVVGGDFDELD